VNQKSANQPGRGAKLHAECDVPVRRRESFEMNANVQSIKQKGCSVKFRDLSHKCV